MPGYDFRKDKEIYSFLQENIFPWNDTPVSVSCVLASFLKISKIKITKFSTHEICYKCRFAKFSNREKSIFKKFRESRNLIRAKLNTRFFYQHDAYKHTYTLFFISITLISISKLKFPKKISILLSIPRSWENLSSQIKNKEKGKGQRKVVKYEQNESCL